MHKKGGLIGYYGLYDWWTSSFSEEERRYIVETYKPFQVGANLNQPGRELVEGSFYGTSGTAAQLLNGLATWFRKTDSDRKLAYKMLLKAEQIASSQGDLEQLHFSYQFQIEFHYPKREDTQELDKAITACQKQIKISTKVAKLMLSKYGSDAPLPSHKGFKQLAIIFDKQKNFDEAISICNQALSQGWNGDWEKRIERYKKKLMITTVDK